MSNKLIDIILPDTVTTWFSVDPMGTGVATLISEKFHENISVRIYMPFILWYFVIDINMYLNYEDV
jgi:hypothetical protein